MFLLSAFPKLPDLTEAVLDSSLLSILITPALYYFIYQPLKKENQERLRIEQELRRSAIQLQDYSQTLEQKVSDRTQELKNQNLQLATLLEKLHSTQVQMVQSEKMSSLGQMVAGIAHEINNPLNFIHGNLFYVRNYTHHLLDLIHLYQINHSDSGSEIELAIQTMDLEFLQEDLPKLLQSMQIGTDRICEIVLSLRNFSRLDEAEVKAVNIHDGINSTLLILQHRLKGKKGTSEISIIFEYGDLPLVECYPGPLNQVIMNILANAIDALEELDHHPTRQNRIDQASQIKIRTSILESKNLESKSLESKSLESKSLESDPIHVPWIQISILDNATGMSEAIRQKIFNPFFTTKAIGEGTGMGMAVSHQIVTEKHGGTLECFSTVGQGTEFRIQIPIHQKGYDF